MALGDGALDRTDRHRHARARAGEAVERLGIARHRAKLTSAPSPQPTLHAAQRWPRRLHRGRRRGADSDLLARTGRPRPRRRPRCRRCRPGGLAVRLGDGAGNFTGSTVVAAANLQSVVLGDVNNDGNLPYDGGPSKIRLNDGQGNFTGGSSVGVSAVDLALGDLDGDGDLDLVTGNHDANTVSVRLNNGDGTFGGRQHACGRGRPRSRWRWRSRRRRPARPPDGQPDRRRHPRAVRRRRGRLRRRPRHPRGRLAHWVAIGDLDGLARLTPSRAARPRPAGARLGRARRPDLAAGRTHGAGRCPLQASAASNPSIPTVFVPVCNP